MTVLIKPSNDPQAKGLILNLLVASGDQLLTSREAVLACALFGITENNARVVINRLLVSGHLLSTGRGQYALGPTAEKLANEVASWRKAHLRPTPWDGRLIAIYCASVPRTDRPVLRRLERGLHLIGAAELDKGLFVRPDNLKPTAGLNSAQSIEQRLRALDIVEPVQVFQICGYNDTIRDQLGALWDCDALNHLYASQIRLLNQWLDDADHLSPDEAAQQSYVLGNTAIRQIIFDPLLPQSMVDTALRDEFFKTVRAFDKAGHRYWKQFFAWKTELVA